MGKIIPIAGPWITDLEVKYTADAAKKVIEAAAAE